VMAMEDVVLVNSGSSSTATGSCPSVAKTFISGVVFLEKQA